MRHISVDLIWKRAPLTICNKCYGTGAMVVDNGTNRWTQDCNVCEKTGLTPIPIREVIAKK